MQRIIIIKDYFKRLLKFNYGIVKVIACSDDIVVALLGLFLQKKISKMLKKESHDNSYFTFNTTTVEW